MRWEAIVKINAGKYVLCLMIKKQKYMTGINDNEEVEINEEREELRKAKEV